MEGIFLWVLSCPVLHQTHSAVVGEVTPPSLLPLAIVKQLKHAYKPVLSVKSHAKNNNIPIPKAWACSMANDEGMYWISLAYWIYRWIQVKLYIVQMECLHQVRLVIFSVLWEQISFPEGEEWRRFPTEKTWQKKKNQSPITNTMPGVSTRKGDNCHPTQRK